jgi:hypothetical protein
MTGNVSKAIASLARIWSGKNVTMGQVDVGKQLINSFITMA